MKTLLNCLLQPVIGEKRMVFDVGNSREALPAAVNSAPNVPHYEESREVNLNSIQGRFATLKHGLSKIFEEVLHTGTTDPNAIQKKLADNVHVDQQDLRDFISKRVQGGNSQHIATIKRGSDFYNLVIEQDGNGFKFSVLKENVSTAKGDLHVLGTDLFGLRDALQKSVTFPNRNWTANQILNQLARNVDYSKIRAVLEAETQQNPSNFAHHLVTFQCGDRIMDVYINLRLMKASPLLLHRGLYIFEYKR